jgi:tRNA A37 threonylcarbamoyltransferase TsaD
VLHTDQRLAAAGNTVQQRFGGGVPELASRAHLEMIERVVWAALLEVARFRELARRQQYNVNGDRPTDEGSL